MHVDIKKIIIGGALLLAILGIGFALVSIFLRSPASTSQNNNPSFGEAGNVVGVVPSNLGGTATELPVFASETGSTTNQQPIFNISGGPAVAGILLLGGQPTTTISRFVMGDSGHVIDMPLDVPGAAPRIVANITVPGIERALFVAKGRGVLLQYLNESLLKTVYIPLPIAGAATSSLAGGAHFLPDNIADIAVSPDGSQVGYLIRSGTGLVGYISKPDGSNTKKIFTLPLTQVVLSWPSIQTFVAESKSASGVPGITLTINAKTGAVSPLLYGAGLTLSANSAFSSLLYRTDNGTSASLYRENIKTGAATLAPVPSPLQSPLPEQCVWSTASSTLAYCAAPIGDPGVGYMDLFHQGLSSVATVLISINAVSGSVVPIATPGTKQGGQASDMIDLSLSPNEHYLSFIAKDDQTLWGVRLK
jgi:hypothetical protein